MRDKFVLRLLGLLETTQYTLEQSHGVPPVSVVCDNTTLMEEDACGYSSIKTVRSIDEKRRSVMPQHTLRRPSRRDVIKVAGMGGMAALASSLGVTRVRAQPKILRIAQWSHFVPAFDEWFDNKFTKEWGEKH